jgi:ArsR family transcriptional regulator
MDELEIAQSKLSWHLKTLSDAGIIAGRREGRWNYYSLNADALGEAKSILADLEPSSRRLVARKCC